MIIRAGMNIYPQEIENAVKSDDHIFDAAAYGIPNNEVGQKIKLKVIVKRNVDKAQVFDVCKRLLPAYHLPDEIEIVSEIPKNEFGKIKR